MKYFSRPTDPKKNIFQEQISPIAQTSRRHLFHHETIIEVSEDLSIGTGTSSEVPGQSGKWEIKSRKHFITSLTDQEKEKERIRGLTELEQKPNYTYNPTNNIEKIVMDHGIRSNYDKDTLHLFVHFLHGEDFHYQFYSIFNLSATF